ncbi:hypothetical protein [Nannocystis radixulma]|uniref:Uncharacterized protein n=1 Tax=Nannocystis radixulma TaxID=2995305 RepID=A0ABT5B0I0_9BACT|nr:hypothetical protein [Nannocystis radixulma]MDC0666682.1 hypothetical protein [Nannocystis radixulma]
MRGVFIHAANPIAAAGPREVAGARLFRLARVTVSFVAAYATEQRPDLTFTVRPAERTVLSLDPGVWRLSVSDPRFEPVTQELRVEAAGAAPQIFELRSRPDGPDRVPERRRR